MESYEKPATSAATVREYVQKMACAACLQRGLRPIVALNETDFRAAQAEKAACALTICGRNDAEMSANIRKATRALKGKYTHLLLNFIIKEETSIARLHECCNPSTACSGHSGAARTGHPAFVAGPNSSLTAPMNREPRLPGSHKATHRQPAFAPHAPTALQEPWKVLPRTFQGFHKMFLNFCQYD